MNNNNIHADAKKSPLGGWGVNQISHENNY
jgi:hypothetical protein